MSVLPFDDEAQYRLPTDVKPTHYDLTIKTDLENLVYHGLLKVDLDVRIATSSITFNSAELELSRATIYSDALKTTQSPSSSSFDNVQERTTYQLADTLPAGSKAELKIAFSGKLSGSMTGYYRSSWQEGGKTKYYALTQFEPTAARRAFPCWDEPLLKATYTITLISRANTVNLSNMPVISEESVGPNLKVSSDIAELLENTGDGEWKITKFEWTPPMSSYLAAYANGEFDFLETSVEMPLSGKTLPLRIYTTKDVIHQARFVLDVTKKVLPLYEKIFDVEYPLPKLDTLVAHDFDVDAMENWGLITGRTNAYLLDPKRPSIQAKKLIAGTQSHEIAHMWFGNITTMEWWNYLYLNEGFATLMGEVIIPVFPEWRVNSEFIIQHLSEAMVLDAKLSSHPIEVDCPDANHINQIFDALSYSKAASVLRMLAYYVGEDQFLKGVSLYLKKKLFANSRTHDLWAGISEATGLDITRLMENWITKVGFPVITVTETSEGSITVRQDRFLETGIAEPEDNETIWNVPLAILSVQDDGKSVLDKTAVLDEREKTIAVDTSRPFKLNAGTNGVYRVLYTPERLAKIAAEAAKETSAFSLEDRLGLVFDSFALAKAGLADLSSALGLVELLKDEKECKFYLVWQGIADNLSAVSSVWWEHPDITDKLDSFRRSLFSPLVHKLGYDYPEDEPSDISLLRKLAIEQASSAGDAGVVAELKSRFKTYADTGDDSQVPAELQVPIFTAAAKFGGRSEYEALIRIHDNSKTPQEKFAAIYGISATQDDALLRETFTFVSDKAREQDIIYFFRSLSLNNKARRSFTEYFQDQYDILYKRFEGSFTLGQLIPFPTSFYSTQPDLDAVQSFFKDKDTSKYNQSLAQALDSIRARIAFLERSSEDLKRWLDHRY